MENPLAPKAIPVLNLPSDVLEVCTVVEENMASDNVVKQIQLAVVEYARVGDCNAAKVKSIAERYSKYRSAIEKGS